MPIITSLEVKLLRLPSLCVQNVWQTTGTQRMCLSVVDLLWAKRTNIMPSFTDCTQLCMATLFGGGMG